MVDIFTDSIDKNVPEKYEFEPEKHLQFLNKMLKSFPSYLKKQETNKLMLLYFIIGSIKILDPTFKTLCF